MENRKSMRIVKGIQMKRLLMKIRRKLTRVMNLIRMMNLMRRLNPVVRGRSFMTSATLGGGGGQPNSDIC